MNIFYLSYCPQRKLKYHNDDNYKFNASLGDPKTVLHLPLFFVLVLGGNERNCLRKILQPIKTDRHKYLVLNSIFVLNNTFKNKFS